MDHKYTITITEEQRQMVMAALVSYRPQPSPRLTDQWKRHYIHMVSCFGILGTSSAVDDFTPVNWR